MRASTKREYDEFADVHRDRQMRSDEKTQKNSFRKPYEYTCLAEHASTRECLSTRLTYRPHASLRADEKNTPPCAYLPPQPELRYGRIENTPLKIDEKQNAIVEN